MKKPAARKTIDVQDAAFAYFCDCHNQIATKPSCVKVDKKTAETQTLGSWRCVTTNKPCKVRRTKKVEAQ